MSNIALVYRLHKIWNIGDTELIGGVYAENFVAHWPASSEVSERRGIDGVRFGVERIMRAFPGVALPISWCRVLQWRRRNPAASQ